MRVESPTRPSGCRGPAGTRLRFHWSKWGPMRCFPLCTRGVVCLLMLAALPAWAHVVPPEQFHPVVESYRRAMFMLNLNPVLWEAVQRDVQQIASGLETISLESAEAYRYAVASAIAKLSAPMAEGQEPPAPDVRREAARQVFDLSTRAMAELMCAEMEELKVQSANRDQAAKCLETARQYWAAFEHEVKSADPTMFSEIGRCWLNLTTALGSAPLLGQGESPVDTPVIVEESNEIIAYVKMCYVEFRSQEGRPLAPVPLASATYDSRLAVPPKLPPGHDINKQRPRPRQILNLVARGGNETDTPLVALGDMVFDSSLVFGEPARSLGINCNTCHNKGVTNPQFVIPGLSSYPGGVDVSGSFFAPHANNGHFDPIDIPDLRGIRFTAPYGRNGRFASLREFVRNVVVNEFNGPEPDAAALDAIVAYMMEFDFLPNPMLSKDGTLNSRASDSAHRGEALFTKPFQQMGDMSCASCHVPSSNFVDGRSHDIGSVAGAEADSMDRALDTPTLLGAKFTAPYFHDGSLATLHDVVIWFDEEFGLNLTEREVADLNAYLVSVGDGLDPYEEDPDAASPSEVEEQYFFMASWEFLRDKGKFELADLLFRTVAQELRNEKWGLKYGEATEIVERMAQLADDAVAANSASAIETVNAKVSEFRKVYEENAELIAGEAAPDTRFSAEHAVRAATNGDAVSAAASPPPEHRLGRN